MPKKKTKIKSKIYFTKVHEKAIIDYVSSQNSKYRNELYQHIIQPALEEMIKKIVYRYKFTSLPNIDGLIKECESHLVAVLSKFDKEKGSKAFSYFSVITKNWFSHAAKKFSAQTKKETQYEEISKSVETEYLSVNNDYVNNKVREEFIKALWNELDQWEKIELKPNEEKVLKSIRILLANSESIDIFNKKAVYLFVREITNLNTKQILNSLNKFRVLYKDFVRRWNNEDE